MLLAVIPESATADDDVPMVERAVKVLSVPDIFKASFNQQAMVKGTINLWGLTVAIKMRGVLTQHFCLLQILT